MSFMNAVYKIETRSKSKVKVIRKVKHLIKLVQDDGWYQAKQNSGGSHRKFKHPTKPGFVTISGKLSADIPRGTLNSALRQAGLK